MSEVFKLNEVRSEPILRLSTGIDELDWLFGRKQNWGIAKGKMTVIGGENGSGKTRLLTKLMRNWDQMGLRCMMYQGEVTASQFASEKMPGYKARDIYLCSNMSIFKQIDIIREYKPDIVITDSVQQIEQWNYGRGAKEIVRSLRAVIESIGTHVFFISHLTATGTLKGGTDLAHEVDVRCFFGRYALETAPDLVYMRVDKNRYGQVGNEAIFCHFDHDIECQSTNRLRDRNWVNDHPQAEIIKKKRWWIF